jgi:hypothetical protein
LILWNGCKCSCQMSSFFIRHIWEMIMAKLMGFGRIIIPRFYFFIDIIKKLFSEHIFFDSLIRLPISAKIVVEFLWSVGSESNHLT